MTRATTYRQSKLIYKRHLPFILLLMAGAYCLLKSQISWASENVFENVKLNSAFTPHFPDRLWNKNRCRTDLTLMSPKLMSDEQLLASARNIKDNASSESQRILNNYWLTMEQGKNYEGITALGKVLSLGYFSYRRAFTPAESNNPFFHVLDIFSEDALITHFKHYDVEVSSKSLIFSFRKNI